MALINYITQIQFRYGAIGLLRRQCDWLGIRRPLIVTDRGVKAAGIVDIVLGALAHARTCLPSGRAGLPLRVFNLVVGRGSEVGQVAAGRQTHARGQLPSPARWPPASALRRPVSRNLQYVAIAAGEGAKLVAGGEAIDINGDGAPGFYIRPALFAETTAPMRINREEVFGIRPRGARHPR